ncbi:MAG TPA: DUF234 domain-containing protein [Egibacteraceae bacterium]|nr:DUF234 domain-containing protein [Egibacteraceae bacterium]
MDFVGRTRELALLARELSRVQASMGTAAPGRCLLVRGRRRVGKSRLIEAFVGTQTAPTLFFTASRQGDAELGHFAGEAARSTLPGATLFEGLALADWDAALRLLHAALPDDRVSIVVIDEFPYLLEGRRDVEATFQKQWDRLLSRKPVLLLLIGSDLAVMEALNTHGRAFYQRGSEFVVRPLSPVETGAIVDSPSAADAFDAYLVSGGMPLVCRDWPRGASLWEFLSQSLSDETSALVVSAHRTLSAEVPEQYSAGAVLRAIGNGERTFANIARASGLAGSSLSVALETLIQKRIVAKDVPLSTKPSRESRYRIRDPYLRFWLTFVEGSMPEIERGRGDRVVDRIRASWSSWRGAAVEPVVREAIRRLAPLDGLPQADAVGGYWTRSNDPEVDIIGGDREPVARVIHFAGSVKWRDEAAFEQTDLHRLAALVARVPGASPETPLLVVSRSGVRARGMACALGPEELLEAWR